MAQWDQAVIVVSVDDQAADNRWAAALALLPEAGRMAENEERG